MELEKSESVLGSLYTLRGGLSAISVERDKAQRADEECYEKLNNIALRVGIEEDDFYDDYGEYGKPKDTVEYAQWICSGGLESKLQDDYQYKLDVIKEQEIKEKALSDKESWKYKSEIEEYHKKAKKNFIIMASCFAVFAGLLIGFLFFIKENKGTEDVAGGVFFMLIPSIILFITSMCFMGFGISNSKEEKRQKQDLDNYFKYLHEEREEEAQRVIREREAETARVAAERKAVEDEYNRLCENLPAIREEARKVLNERNATISPLVESCNTYYKALTTQFTPLLDERDWQHLDLVIYQLETRRADNIKEALQLVDRELQTERLENSIKAAIKSICFTLQRGFTSLQDSININCAKISDIIISTSAEIIAQNKLLADSVKGQIAELTDSVNVGNALQEKANESSAQLVEDVYELRRFNTDFYV